MLGSGNNLVVFALAGMGARVTSVDISQKQLDTAAVRAVELGLEVTFVRVDVVDLSSIEDGSFDLVYTGGHVAVWVSDLKAYYSQAGRILRPGGMFMVSEYHPFRRVWQDSPSDLNVKYRYLDRGPHEYDRSQDIESATAGTLSSYEFNWTVGDYVSNLFGDDRVSSSVTCQSFRVPTDPRNEVPILSVSAARRSSDGAATLAVVNWNNSSPVTAALDLAGTAADARVTAYEMAHQDPAALNTFDEPNKVRPIRSKLDGLPQTFTFKPNSLTMFVAEHG